MSEIRVDGVSLYYEEHDAGEPIVCIHGIDPAHSVVLAFVDEVLALKEEPSIA